MSGRLFLVATPIGNLDDLSPRAVAVLGEVDVIACEDTRRTGRLLQHAGISGPKLVSVRDANEAARAQEIVTWLQAGKNVALVSDAGTPAISDPGYKVVKAVTGAKLEAIAIPGPSALLTALITSGLPTDRFVFEGFLPRKGGDRTRRLAAIAAERRTIVLYEAPHRVLATLVDLEAACGGDRVVAVARELTKLHEEIWRGQLRHAASGVGEPRGEYVLVLGGALPSEPADDAAIVGALADHMAGGEDRKTAVTAVAKELEVPRRRVYALSLPDSSAAQDEQT
ncbi:MAG TPA: 16S rRNA (cytidine(1402)-2'-O)-methyltransferase [Acidimicrobiales bacterium]|nr:16S rRNA (cytidine(1402)-2'-O)-methyltransferase [Acidimicrobiales bacterium]